MGVSLARIGQGGTLVGNWMNHTELVLRSLYGRFGACIIWLDFVWICGILFLGTLFLGSVAFLGD